MDKIVVRKLRKKDADAVSRIYDSIVKTSEKIDFKRIFEEQDQQGSGFTAFVAEIEGTILGYMISYIISGGFGIDKSAWITMLGVEPKCMGQGIGRSLAKEARSLFKARGINSIYTTVEWDSTDMLSFFKTLGFDRSDIINLHKVIE
ncbi:GNAT family N-acetyltransferase [Deltaproteobacteria bacterium]|nr:GNAT family N-acetyltransferase [Deltaproteobacteria bacterium]